MILQEIWEEIEHAKLEPKLHTRKRGCLKRLCPKKVMFTDNADAEKLRKPNAKKVSKFHYGSIH